MWPWGHAAVGYLIYSGLARGATEKPPTGPATIAVLVGTMLPDLIDKPFAWTVPVLPSGRSLGHSWLVAGIVLLGLVALFRHRRRLIAALGVGWLSHGLADAVSPLYHGEFHYLGFLLWPVTDAPYSPEGITFLGKLLGLTVDADFLFEWVLVVMALLAWHLDGRPGLAGLRRRLGDHAEATQSSDD